MITNYHAQHLLATDLSSLRFASKCTPDRLLWSGTARLTSYLWHFRPAIDRTTGWQWHSRRRRRWTRVLRSLGFGLATDVHLLSSPSSGCFSWSRLPSSRINMAAPWRNFLNCVLRQTSSARPSRNVKNYYTYSHEPFHPLKRQPVWQTAQEAVSVIKSGQSMSHARTRASTSLAYIHRVDTQNYPHT